MLVAIGDLVEDVVVWLDGPPQRGTDTSARIHRRRGGSAANVARFAAAVAAPSRFIGQVGDDALAGVLVADLEHAGVDVCVRREGRTGAIVVLVEPGGERTMLPDRAACTELATIDDGWLDGVKVLHVPTYSLTIDPLATTARRAIVDARERGAEISVDVSSVDVVRTYGIERYVGLLRELRPDWLFANEDEHRLLAAQGLDARTVQVVKQGPDPVLVVASGRTTSSPVPPVADVRDSTGAGDAFAAGFLAARHRESGVSSCVTAGIELAQRVLRNPGASL